MKNLKAPLSNFQFLNRNVYNKLSFDFLNKTFYLKFLYFFSKFKTKYEDNKMINLNNLPIEILVKIYENSDIENLQKLAWVSRNLLAIVETILIEAGLPKTLDPRKDLRNYVHALKDEIKEIHPGLRMVSKEIQKIMLRKKHSIAQVLILKDYVESSLKKKIMMVCDFKENSPNFADVSHVNNLGLLCSYNNLISKRPILTSQKRVVLDQA